MHIVIGRGGIGMVEKFEWPPAIIGQQRMAKRTIEGDRLTGVIHQVFIMATETSGGVVMPDMVGITPPADIHPGVDIAIVDFLQNANE